MNMTIDYDIRKYNERLQEVVTDARHSGHESPEEPAK
jgi:hypothetical protein